MSTKYYKTSEPAVIAAYQKMMADAHDLRDRAQACCNEFDAMPVIGQCAREYRYHGMRLNGFDVREDRHLWTRPDPNYGGLSKVRSRLTGHSAELKELRARVKQHWPEPDTVSKDGLYQALGTNWGNILLCGIAITEYNGTLYLATSATLTGCTEITGSEYQQAEREEREKAA
ncbi:hypothetical protein PU634_04935 [Oceanimonas pelagia]|uniref:Uncharacterized protein n=1 Tax=Oceanimonas pelagia TaxID=3028314 RepID=A0AA50KRG6_9GAMM|nr:hypothetical protein [Oceanimonas pelagia]WMC11712.1 hypothetical protein PU634_04935 [Oceanimonas pelagia]